MIDRERKRQADRERRALIKAGKWDFPDGGSAERARAGLPIDNNPARQRAAIDAQKAAVAPKTYSFPHAAPMRPVISASPSAPISPPSSSRALTIRPQPPSMVAGVAGGRRVPTGYDAGTYPIAPPERPVAVNTIWQRNVERALIGLATDNQDLRARVEELEADRRRREVSPDWQEAGFALLSMLGGWKRA